MTYALYADQVHIDDIGPARGILDLNMALEEHEPDHPLTTFLDSFTISLPENPEEQIDTVMELLKLDFHMGEPIDSTIARLMRGIRTAFGHAPREIILSDGLGDEEPQLIQPPTEQDDSSNDEDDEESEEDDNE